MKLLTKELCPHCKKEFESEKDLENFDIKKNVGTIEKVTPDPITIPTEPEVKEVIKEVTKIPSHIPAYKCKDKKCGKMHPNPNYDRQIVGKCTNCGQFTADLNSKCQFCEHSEYDELDKDELKDLGIPEPKEFEHEHESE